MRLRWRTLGCILVTPPDVRETSKAELTVSATACAH
jgi:hypothetical protein